MSNFDSTRWCRLRADLAKAYRQGMLENRRIPIASGKNNFSTEDGRQEHKLIALKIKVHQAIADLGARVYSLMWSGRKNAGEDARVKDITARIRKYETEIEFMEKYLKTRARKRMEKAT